VNLNCCLSTLFFLFITKGFCQTDPVIHSLYLIGDTGKDTIASEAIQLLYFECFDDTAGTVLLLGDNVYPDGNNPYNNKKNTYKAERILISQLEALYGYNGNCYMIPGNHDWSCGKPSGMKAVKAQAELVNTWSKTNSAFRNKGKVYFEQPGLPGPQSVLIHPQLRLVMLDSQWWMQADLLHPTGKLPGKSRKGTRRQALNELDSLLTAADKSGEIVIIAAHHPLYSNGKHSHRRQPLRFLFNYTPLHILSWFGLNRMFREDLPQPRYKRYVKSLLKITEQHSNVIYVSGHEHTMQYMIKGKLHHIISGSGSHTKTLDRYKQPAKFMDDQQPGFFSLTLHESGEIYLHAFGIRERGEYWRTFVTRLPK